jgi:hypothetical protein
MTSTKTRGRRDDPYSFDQFIVKMHRSKLGTAWRWRTELLTLGGLGAALYWLSRQVGMHWAAVVLAAALGIVFILPWSRRFIVAGSGACWHATGSTGCAGRPGCTPAPDGCPWSCGPGRRKSVNG